MKYLPQTHPTANTWLRYLALISISLLLCSCSLIGYRPTVKQGQYITTQQNAQLKSGMSLQQVTDLLGSPVYSNPLQDQQLIYVYTIKPGRQRQRQQQLVLYFKHKRLYKRHLRALR